MELNLKFEPLLKVEDDFQFENKTYSYNADTSRLTELELFRELKKFCPNIESLMEKRNHIIEDEIQHNIQRANESNTLEEDDKKTLKNNIDIMHDYLVQRSINKSVYYCAVDALAELLKHDNITHVITPMFQTFAHVLHSVQGVLQKDKFSIDTKIDIYQENGKLLVKLQVQNT